MNYILLVVICLHIRAAKSLENTCSLLEHEVKKGIVNYQCSENYVCNKSYTITNRNLRPYIYLFSVENSLLKKCCGKCMSSVSITTVSPISEIHDIIYTTSPDFVFPILHKSRAERLYSYFFIPVVRSPNFIYITQMPESSFFYAVRACLNLYPLLIVCLLMSLVAGFVVWFMETRSNRAFFPRSFLNGWFNGIWWSTVTLVSTGLERTPKTLPGRIFALIWIVIGVTMLGLLTSSITAVMIKRIPSATMKGAKVGALKYRLYEEYMITKHGGYIVHDKTLDLREQFYKLIHQFRLKEIDGLLFDKYILGYAHGDNDRQTLDEKHDSDTQFDLTNFMNYTVHTEEIDDGEDMSYGILVKESNVHKYFSDAIKDNWLYYESIFVSYAEANTHKYRQKYVTNVHTARLATIFSPDDPYVYYAMAGFGATLVLICVIGIIYERIRHGVRTYSIKTIEMTLPPLQIK